MDADRRGRRVVSRPDFARGLSSANVLEAGHDLGSAPRVNVASVAERTAAAWAESTYVIPPLILYLHTVKCLVKLTTSLTLSGGSGWMISIPGLHVIGKQFVFL